MGQVQTWPLERYLPEPADPRRSYSHFRDSLTGVVQQNERAASGNTCPLIRQSKSGAWKFPSGIAQLVCVHNF